MQNSRSLKEAFDLLSNCDKHATMRRFAKYKKLYGVFSKPS